MKKEPKNELLLPLPPPPYLSKQCIGDEKIPVPTTDVPNNIKNNISIIIRLMELKRKLNKSIVGQEEAIDVVESLIKTSYAGLRDNNRPKAIMMFTGPTGCGKTELARQTAKQLNRPLIRLDMSEYQERISYTRLVGAAPGYVGHEDGGQLVIRIKESPDCVLLLDEIEKASPDVLKVFLQVFDHATLTSSLKGVEANFQDTIIIMTSNICAVKKTGNVGFVEQGNNDDHLKSELKRHFSPEWLNRIDAIIPFNHLTRENMLKIVQKQMKILKIKLKQRKIDLSVTEDCMRHLAEEGFSYDYCARNVSRLIDKKIKSLLVDDILWGRLSNGGSVSIKWSQDAGYFIEINRGTDNLWF